VFARNFSEIRLTCNRNTETNLWVSTCNLGKNGMETWLQHR